MTEISELLNQYTELSLEVTGKVRVFKGTLVSAWFVLTLIEADWSQEDIAKHYVSIQPEAIVALYEWCENQQDLKHALDALRQGN
ncbi:DUF433 domain-containing protein [Trichocoleus desertorum AS-A10]|uniref:DUF433 domain-containing protein n=1 Tax=Trichocoleus desertorum TaxID=1481672 RepID=UPI003299FF51